MNYKSLIGLLCAMFVAGTLASCGGGGARTQTETSVKTTTTGQELVDLKKALDSGAITQKDYDKQRERILKSTR